MPSSNPPSSAFSISMIGVFDSGIGGLAVIRGLREALPGHDLVFFADTARSPYAEKSMEAIARFADQGIRHLETLGAEMLVLSCSAAAAAFLIGKIGPCRVPVVEGITPAVAAALAASKNRRFGVIGSRAAMDSGIHGRLIRDRAPDARVHTQASTLLDALIEEGWARRPETARIAKKLLHPLKVRQMDTLILDSSYLSVIEKKMAVKAGRKVSLVRSWEILSLAAKAALAENPVLDRTLGKNGSLKILVTDRTAGLEDRCRWLFKFRTTVERIPMPSGA